MGDWNSWIISSEQRANYDTQFQLLNPINGLLTGEQLKPYFLKFGLSVQTLGQIWSLADMDVDGNLNRKEFAIAMFLIHKSLAYLPLPPTLPAGLRNYSVSGIASPVPFSASFPLRVASPTKTVHTNGEVTAPLSSQIENTASKQPDYQNWVISPEARPKYRLMFNQHDRLKRGYITGIEARGIFVGSGLSQQILAHIWTLADLDKDGNLNGDEFCIARFLIDKALAGSPLPATLPTGLLPSASRTSDQTSAAVKADGHSDGGGGMSPTVSFEDKRRENFLQGQIELDKRKQELAEKFRLEEQNRLEKERQERERQERIRLEQEERKALEAERQAEYLRELEAQKEIRRRQAFEERTQAWRAAEAQRLAETERQRVEMLMREKLHAQTLFEQAVAHRASLLESATAQEQRRRELNQRLLITTDDLNSHKTAITEMRSKRDTYERDIRELTEQVEAAKAELTRWQREREELQLRQSSTSPTAELHKSLTASQAVHRDDIKRLNLQLVQLESRMTEQGQELARRRNTVGDMEQRCSLLQSEVDGLRQTLLGKLKSNHYSKQDAQPVSGDIGSGVASSADRESYDVMFNFTARHPDELSLTTGSVVHVIPNPPMSVAAGWLYGESGGRKGLFPESYVRKREAGKIDPFDPFGVHRAAASSDAPSVTTSSQQQQPASVDPASQSIKNAATSDPSSSEPARPVLFKCVAIYPFDSTVAGDLKLAVGDVVDVYNVRDEWWEGICERTKLSGIFPANYAKKMSVEDSHSQRNYNVDLTAVTEPGEVIWPDSTVATSQPPQIAGTHPETSAPTTTSSPAVSTPTTTNTAPQPVSEPCATLNTTADTISTTTSPELARVIAPYTATATGQLSLQLGQVVQVRKRSTNGWWEGELQQRGRGRLYGWFPADYVQVIPPPNASTNGSSSASGPILATTPTTTNSSTTASPASSIIKSTARPAAPKTTVEMMQAIFTYKAAHADELSFDEGSIITVLGRDEPEWWRGRLQSTGAEGLFPVNYVRPYRPVNAESGAEVPDARGISSSIGQ